MRRAAKTDLQEDDKRQQDGQRHGDLLAGGGRQIERDHAENRYQHGRHDQIDGVEQRLAAQIHVVVRFRRVARLLVALVHDLRRYVEDVPRTALFVVGQVHLQTKTDFCRSLCVSLTLRDLPGGFCPCPLRN